MAAPTVLLGVTGCIAAYKACEILRGLQKAGVQVKVVMTEHATEFVGSLTFGALSGEPAAVSMFGVDGDLIPHIRLAESCDVFLIAPCTANVAAKLAGGIADDLLTSTALACTAPIMVAPAMNVHMFQAEATQHNLQVLRDRGVIIIEPDDGYLACGDVGSGRLAEPERIVDAVMALLGKTASGESTRGQEMVAQAIDSHQASMQGTDNARRFEAIGDSSRDMVEGESDGSQPDASRPAVRDLVGKSVFITAGPTREPIDAVRYISNYSSGKMGYALACAAAARGAAVTLVSGPVALEKPDGVNVVSIVSARDMLAAAEKVFPSADIAICAAAVADYRPAEEADHKLKKGRDDALLNQLSLVKNPDILATLASQKRPDQIVVGFAAETEDVLDNAREKLATKHADMIVANEVGPEKTFGADEDTVWLVTPDTTKALPTASKDAVADMIFDAILA